MVKNTFAERVFSLVVLAFLSSSALTVLGLMKLDAIRYADFSADRFGFPYSWVEHVRETFAGPADYWNVETPSFLKNVGLYFLPTFGFWVVIFLFRQRKAKVTTAKKMMI